MQAVVLVGGFGTRLRPLTHTRPKQMLPIVHRPMIEHVVDHLARYGVDEVVLSLGFQPDAFAAAYPEGHCNGVRLVYAVEPEPLDTAGAIRFAAEQAGIGERFLAVNGDVLTNLDVAGLVAFHDDRAAQATIFLHPVDDPSRYGVVPTDETGRVVAFVEKPPRESAPTNLINAGIYVLEPSVLDRIPTGRKVSIERETFPGLVADGGVYARPGATYWIDAGTPQAYLQAQLDVLDGVRDLDGLTGLTSAGVHPTAVVDPTATVIRSVIGAHAVVEAGARVERSVLLPHASVGEGAVVEDSALGEGATVAAGAVVTDGTVVGDGEVVEAGTRLEGARVPVLVPT